MTNVVSLAPVREIRGTDRNTMPPSCVDLQAERAVLAAILLDGEVDGQYGVWRRVSTIVTREDFYSAQHAVMFDAFGRVIASGGDLDVVTGVAELRSMERLNTAGGAQAIGEITDEIPTLTHCESHARIVAELSARRRLGTMLANHARRLASGHGTAADVQSKALADIRAIRLPGAKLQTITDDALAWADRMKRRVEGTEVEQVLSTSMSDLSDALRGGWRCGLNLIASRPNIGKTMLTTQEVVHIARNHGPVLYISLEARREQIMDAMVSCVSGVPLNSIVNARSMTQEQMDLAFLACQYIDSLPITIVDIVTRGCPRTAREIEAAVMSLPKPPVMVAIDHIRKMRPVGRHEHIRNALGEISEHLHDLGLSHGIAVNALIHISRGPKGVTCRLPTMEDLKDSGDLEENADSVLILHSEFRYPTEKYGKGNEPPKEIIDVFVPKLRNAEAGGYAKIRQAGAVQRFFSTIAEGNSIVDIALVEPGEDDGSSRHSMVHEVRRTPTMDAGRKIFEESGELPDVAYNGPLLTSAVE